MAGRKITQLPTLTTPSATDKLVIVDVSDTSESPQGTSKQIAFENLGIGEDFIPTISNITNGATVTSSSGFCYRSGNYETMVFSLEIELGASFAGTDFNFSIPVASNFSNARQMIVTCNLPTNLTFLLGNSDATNNNGFLSVLGTANGDSILELQVSATYKIIP